MRKNPMVQGIKAKGTPSKGDSSADANMPANNVGTFPVKLAAGQKSSFGVGVNQKAGQAGYQQKSSSPKVNMSANNKTDNGPAMGTTHHAVGTVPAYLRAKNK